MKFYTTLHKYYCGIDLHAKILYVCILDQQGNKLVHQKIEKLYFDYSNLIWAMRFT